MNPRWKAVPNSQIAPALLVLTACALVGCGSNQGGIPVIRNGNEFARVLDEARTLSRDAMTKFERGQALTQEEKESIRKSRDLFTGLRDFDDTNPVPQFGLAKMNRALDDTQTAIAEFSKTVTLLESFADRTPVEQALLAESYAELSRLALLQNRIKDAETAARAARQINPREPRYAVDLASALFQARKLEEARKITLEALALDPALPRAKALLQLLKEEETGPGSNSVR